jgi:tetratricopeptide (TPR) repeat protein
MRWGCARNGVVAGAMALMWACTMTHQDLAQQYYSQGRLDQAEYQIQKALDAQPNNLAIDNLAARIFTQQGVAHYKRGEMISAGNYFHRAIDYYSTYAPAYDYLGLIAFARHDWRNAIRYSSQGAGYSGKPEPGYVQLARQELSKVRSGQPFVRPRPRPQ